jgi:steroid delta-isomerase-like uncharacterized protein
MSNAENFRAFIDAFNSDEFDAMREIAGNSVYHESATGREAQGEEYMALLKGWRTAFPNLTGEITSLMESGDTVVAEITWTGTHDGPLGMPDGSAIPATGNPMRNEAAMVARYKDGVPDRSNHYFDLMTVMRTAGVA